MSIHHEVSTELAASADPAGVQVDREALRQEVFATIRDTAWPIIRDYPPDESWVWSEFTLAVVDPVLAALEAGPLAPLLGTPEGQGGS